MKVTKNITIDLNNPRRHVVHLMESGNQREIVLTLLKDGMPFDVSEGIGTATLVEGVGYIKANGIPGYYDLTSADEDAVVAVSGTTNKWTVRLDEHATDVPGFAQIFVKFSLASGETLYSFPITLDVIKTSGGTTDPDQPWYHSSTFILAGAQPSRTAEMSAKVGYDAATGRLYAESMMIEQARSTLLNMLEKQAYTVKNARAMYNELASELFPAAEIVSISAVFEQGSAVIYNTASLDDLRPMLTVTATFDDASHAVVTAYTLSGTLTVGTSTITATYRGKTATFNVTVTENLRDGYIVVGSPTISENILTPANGGYIRNKREFSPTGAWMIQFSVKTTAGTTGQNIFMTADSNGERIRSIQCQFFYSSQSGLSIYFYGSSNGTSWNLFSATGASNQSAGHYILFQFKYTGTKYQWRLSVDDGTTWYGWYDINASDNILGGGYLCFGPAQGTTAALIGSLDLTKLKVWAGDELWWDAVPDGGT